MFYDLFSDDLNLRFNSLIFYAFMFKIFHVTLNVLTSFSINNNHKLSLHFQNLNYE